MNKMVNRHIWSQKSRRSSSLSMHQRHKRESSQTKHSPNKVLSGNYLMNLKPMNHQLNRRVEKINKLNHLKSKAKFTSSQQLETNNLNSLGFLNSDLTLHLLSLSSHTSRKNSSIKTQSKLKVTGRFCMNLRSKWRRRKLSLRKCMMKRPMEVRKKKIWKIWRNNSKDKKAK